MQSMNQPITMSLLQTILMDAVIALIAAIGHARWPLSFSARLRDLFSA